MRINERVRCACFAHQCAAHPFVDAHLLVAVLCCDLCCAVPCFAHECASHSFVDAHLLVAAPCCAVLCVAVSGSYTHLRAHETGRTLVRLFLLEYKLIQLIYFDCLHYL